MEKGARVRVMVGASVTAITGDKVYVTFDDGAQRVYSKREVYPLCPPKGEDRRAKRKGQAQGTAPTRRPNSQPQLAVHKSRVAQAFEIATIDETLKDQPEGWYYNL
jgi:hypothetical protein